MLRGPRRDGRRRRQRRTGTHREADCSHMRPRGLLARGSGGNAANRWHQHYQRPPCSVAGECAVVTRSCCRRLLGGGGSLTRGCGAVLTVLRGPPARGHGLVLSPSGSQIALAGSRPTGGTCPGCESGQVDARVVVPVDDQATLLAVVGALGQGQFGFHCPWPSKSSTTDTTSQRPPARTRTTGSCRPAGGAAHRARHRASPGSARPCPA